MLGSLLALSAQAGDRYWPPIVDPPTGTHTPGRFVWGDLVTSDVAAAAGFYGKVFGWTFETYGGDDDRDTYTLALADGLPIGGMVFDQRAMKGKTPSARWVGLISVADVKASTAAVTAGGGKVVYAPVMLGERGETAVFRDPEGVVFGVVNSKNGDPSDFAGDVNEWYWVDLWTSDVEKAAAFYRSVVGYETIPIADDGPRSGLRLLSGGFARAGIMQKQSNEDEFDLAAVHPRRRREGVRRGRQGRRWQGSAGTARHEPRDGRDHCRPHGRTRRHCAGAGPGGAAMTKRNDMFLSRLTAVLAVATAAVTLGGCASDGGDSSYSGVSTSVSVGYGYGGYYGGGYYPGYYPGGYPPVVVVPPDRPGNGGGAGNRPDRPTTLPADVHGSSSKPAPMPSSRPADVSRPTSRPSPRPAPRPMPRGRR